MNIGFEAKRAFHNTTGLGNYCRDVIRVLHRHGPQHEYFAYTPRPGRVPFDLPGGRFHVRFPAGLLRGFPAAWRSAGVVRDLRRDRIDLFHGLAAELPIGVERAGIASVVTVHDLIWERLPDLYRPVDRLVYRHKCRSAVRRAGVVIAISEQTRRDVVELYGVDESKIRVVHQGTHPAFQAPADPAADAEVARRRELAPGFLLSVGTVERRKNLLATVRALEGLPVASLVVVGRETAYADEVRRHLRERGLEQRVRFLSGVPVTELAALYRLAAALVYPSAYEGFGIPIVEALFCGTPVVTSRGGCFEEAAGPGSAYVDPGDPEQLRTAIAEILGSPERRREMSARGRAHAERFRDAAVAGALLAAYEEACRGLSARKRPV